ncbi:hypothetical protein BS78_01G139300 [Paspalum vaginatum]|nr:hypothetical protein BS78_01G139300 [Paspalum vaginatum]
MGYRERINTQSMNPNPCPLYHRPSPPFHRLRPCSFVKSPMPSITTVAASKAPPLPLLCFTVLSAVGFNHATSFIHDRCLSSTSSNTMFFFTLFATDTLPRYINKSAIFPKTNLRGEIFMLPLSIVILVPRLRSMGHIEGTVLRVRAVAAALPRSATMEGGSTHGGKVSVSAERRKDETGNEAIPTKTSPTSPAPVL